MDKQKSYDIVGIGNAVVDLISSVDDEFLEKFELQKASMTLVDKDFQDLLLSGIPDPQKVAGGSAANTLRTIGMLNLDCGFIGAVSDDEPGHHFLKSMLDSGVEFLLEPINTHVPTGTCAIFVTPDSERTMRTHMGASDLITDENLENIEPHNISLFFVEGYQFDTKEHKEAINNLAKKVKASGGKVSLTVSDVFCINDHRSDFLDFLKIVDVLFCNENEFKYLFESDIDRTMNELVEVIRNYTEALTVVTRSEKGCIVFENQDAIAVPAIHTDRMLDATGAGDQFAAGFLYGYLEKMSIEKCAIFGAELATAVISKIGPFLTIDEVESARQKWLTRIKTDNNL